MKKKARILLILLGLLVIIITAGFIYLRSQIMPPENNQNQEESLRFEVPMGTSTYTIARELQNAGLIKNARF